MPDPANLSSALGDAVTEGRQFLARLESMSQTLGSQLARHEEAAREWSAERQAIKDEEDRLRATLRTINETIAAERKRLAQLERELDAARQERDQATADRDAAAADRDRARDQLELVTRDRDALQTDQIQWGLDHERMLGEVNQLTERATGLERDLGSEREQHLALQARHAELTEQANRLASDWVSRRQALTAEIQAQNEEMQQVRKALEEARAQERHIAAGPLTPVASMSPEQSAAQLTDRVFQRPARGAYAHAHGRGAPRILEVPARQCGVARRGRALADRQPRHEP